MYTIKIPPLRERKKDIIPLANHFVRQYGAQKTPAIESISKELEVNLQNYAFPGNIRELENMIASAVLLETQSVLQTESVRSLPQLANDQKDIETEWLTLVELEKRQILRALKKSNGNRKNAAKILGINTATVYRKLEKYGISE
ncbi:MAG: helix-turn-helix domain-containing protein, partial [Desulfatirhabdiaceae bacterium]